MRSDRRKQDIVISVGYVIDDIFTQQVQRYFNAVYRNTCVYKYIIYLESIPVLYMKIKNGTLQIQVV